MLQTGTRRPRVAPFDVTNDVRPAGFLVGYFAGYSVVRSWATVIVCLHSNVCRRRITSSLFFSSFCRSFSRLCSLFPSWSQNTIDQLAREDFRSTTYLVSLPLRIVLTSSRRMECQARPSQRRARFRGTTDRITGNGTVKCVRRQWARSAR